MKKSIAILLSLLLIAALLSLAGCSKDKAGEQAASTKVTEKTTNSDTSELEKLFKSANAAKGFSYDMVSTVKGPQGTMTSQGKLYVSGKKMRMEMETQGMKSIILYNGSGDAYMYIPSTKTAMKTPMPKEKPADQWAASEQDLTKFKIVDHETIDGVACVVVTTAENEVPVKAWLREDIGLPARMEYGDDTNKTVIEYKNYQVGPQDDSLFNLPAGVQVMDMSKIQGGQIPGGLPPGVNLPQPPQRAQ